MNVLKKIKKIAAITVGMAMVASTGFAAVSATTLGDFPAPYVTDGVFSGKIVIGENAATADVIGALDIATALQAAAGSPVDVAGGVSVAGGQLEDIPIGSNIADSAFFTTTVDDVDLPGSLSSYSLRINNDATNVDEKYDVHEEIQFVDTAIFAPQTAATMLAADSLGLAASDSETFGSDVFVPAKAGNMMYCLAFDETLETGNFFNDSSSDDPIYMDFLGRNLEVTGATATGITIKVGESYWLDAGDSVVVEGKTITLRRTTATGSGTAFIDVDGVSENVDLDDSQEINGINIQVDEIVNDDGTEFDSAKLLIGEETEETYADGDAFIGEDTKDYAWEWELSGLATNNPTICARWAIDVNRPGETDVPKYEHPLYEGESYTFPFGYASVTFDSLTVSDDEEYSVETTTKTLYDSTGTTAYHTDANVIKLQASGLSDQGFIANSTKTDTIYLYDEGNTVGVYRSERDGNKALFVWNVSNDNTLFEVDYKKSNFDVTLQDWNLTANGNAGIYSMANLTFEFGATDYLKIWVDSSGSNATAGGFTYLGQSDSDTTSAGDIQWSADGTTYTHLDTREADFRTQTGVIIEDPDSAVSSDEFAIHVPSDMDDYKANIVVSGTGTTTTTVAGTTAVKVNPLAVGLAVSDVDGMGLLGRENLIVIGGPCANSVASSLLGNPADCTTGFEEGYGKIQWFEDQSATLVAGYKAVDTTKAARVLAEYAANADELAGKAEVKVITSTGAITGVE